MNYGGITYSILGLFVLLSFGCAEQKNERVTEIKKMEIKLQEPGGGGDGGDNDSPDDQLNLSQHFDVIEGAVGITIDGLKDCVCKRNPLADITCNIICTQAPHVQGMTGALGEKYVELEESNFKLKMRVRFSADGTGGADTISGNEGGIELRASVTVTPSNLTYAAVAQNIAATRFINPITGHESYIFNPVPAGGTPADGSKIVIASIEMPMKVKIKLEGNEDLSLNAIFVLGGGTAEADGGVSWNSRYFVNQDSMSQILIAGDTQERASEKYTQAIRHFVKEGLDFNERQLLTQIKSQLKVLRKIRHTLESHIVQQADSITVAIEKETAKGKASFQGGTNKAIVGAAVGCSRAIHEMMKYCPGY